MTVHDQPPTDVNRAGGPTHRRALAWSWLGYAAAAVAFSFAAVTFYWSAGGMAGVSTLGGRFEEWAVARDPMIVTLLWFTGVLKVAGGMLALALVQPWGAGCPGGGSCWPPGAGRSC